MDSQLRLIPRATNPGGSTDGAARTRPTRPRRTPDKVSDAPTGATHDEPVEAPVRWRIDNSARERGRAGITQAREALRRARRPAPDGTHTTAA